METLRTALSLHSKLLPNQILVLSRPITTIHKSGTVPYSYIPTAFLHPQSIGPKITCDMLREL